ncbi:DNA alkylation repair protein [Pseudalkalibacillus hwajinpoensis]|uniref:DNA alkylation repair protein n=1 Tax=Guptibacillus hwajinpoensis TaxID=208199 RepID=UPI00325B1225
MVTVKLIQEALAPFCNCAQAKQMESYMRDQFPFLGIKTPERRKAVKEVLKAQEFPNEEVLKNLVYTLWNLKEREYQNVALDLLDRVKHYPIDYIELIETLMTTKSWWDTVDGLAVHSAGTYFQQFPDRTRGITEKWITSQNMWLNRSAILFQLSYKNKTDFEMLKRYILIHANSNEFFHQKAIGWALREYSKTNSEDVVNFVNENNLAPLSKREALKFLKKQQNTHHTK